MNTPAQRSALVVPALVFVTVVAIALAFGAVNEIMFVRTNGGRTIELVTGAFGALVSALMFASAVTLWRGVRNARSLAIVTALVTIGFCAFVMMPGNRIVGAFALLLSVLASAVLAWIARRGAVLAPA